MNPTGRGPAVPIVVQVRGPGHHERTEQARPVVAALVAAGYSVTVTAGLRPRLADDVRALIDSGATAVHLVAPGLRGTFAASAGPDQPGRPDGTDTWVETDIVVELAAAAAAGIVVVGEGPAVERVRRVLEDR